MEVLGHRLDYRGSINYFAIILFSVCVRESWRKVVGAFLNYS